MLITKVDSDRNQNAKQNKLMRYAFFLDTSICFKSLTQYCPISNELIDKCLLHGQLCANKLIWKDPHGDLSGSSQFCLPLIHLFVTSYRRGVLVSITIGCPRSCHLLTPKILSLSECKFIMWKVLLWNGRVLQLPYE